MIDLEAIAKDAAERVHKNGGCVPQLAFAPILFALQDALAVPSANAENTQSALTDLVSWFDKPVQGERGMVWVIRAGDQGADDAVAAARSATEVGTA